VVGHILIWIGEVQYIIQSVCSCGEETLRCHIAKIKQSLAILISSLTLILIEVLQYFELFPMRINISRERRGDRLWRTSEGLRLSKRESNNRTRGRVVPVSSNVVTSSIVNPISTQLLNLYSTEVVQNFVLANIIPRSNHDCTFDSISTTTKASSSTATAR
jgi:hypothetical protein